jgi:hypothetical protein
MPCFIFVLSITAALLLVWTSGRSRSEKLTTILVALFGSAAGGGAGFPIFVGELPHRQDILPCMFGGLPGAVAGIAAGVLWPASRRIVWLAVLAVSLGAGAFSAYAVISAVLRNMNLH